MAYRALTQVLLGASPPVEAGEEIPETYANQLGDPEPVDFDRLVELGAAEKVTAKRGRSKPDGESPEENDEPES